MDSIVQGRWREQVAGREGSKEMSERQFVNYYRCLEDGEE